MYQNQAADKPGLGDHLNLADPVELNLWSKLLNVDPEELQLAAEIVGPDYGNLVAYLADSPF